MPNKKNMPTEYSVEELNPPDWLNKAFFLKVVKHFEKETKIDLQEIDISPATPKNDHYSSIMFRVKLRYAIENRIKEKSVILKTLHEVNGCIKNSNMFETEIGVYTKVIPKFEEILKAAGNETQFGPDCLYYSLNPKKVIILEDMIPHGYTVLRMRQTNYEETKAIYAKLAKWHAVSYKLILEQSEFFKNHHNNPLNENNWRHNGFVKDAISNFIEMLNEHEDLIQYKKYFEPLKLKILDYVEATFNEYKRNPSPLSYYVLSHGDLHHRNMLFKYDQSTSKLLDVLLIDYQMCTVRPIANDIINSSLMLIDSEQRLKNLDELIEFYFSAFQETLKKIGFSSEMPKMIEFLKQLSSHFHLAIFLLTSYFPVVLAMQDFGNDIIEMLSEPEGLKTIYTNPRYVNEVRRLLPIYLNLGCLE